MIRTKFIPKPSLIKNISLITLLFTFFISSSAQEQPSQKEDTQITKTLKVGVAGTEPFVVDVNEQSGISLEIWQTMANIGNIKYHIVSYNSVPDLLKAVKDKKVDLAVGPISINAERAQEMNFTQPYFQSGLAIMSYSESPSLWQRIKVFINIDFLLAIIGFLIILGIVGTLLWLTERNKNTDEFPKDPARGIANGMWCAIVTMSTTGYGDRSPRSFWGRVIAGTWMVVCIALAVTMVASISSTLTLSGAQRVSINKIEQVSGQNIGVIENSLSEDLVKRYNGNVVSIKGLEEGFNELKNHNINALIYDKTQMVYYLKHHKNNNIAISSNIYAHSGYGFALPRGSNYIYEINNSLLKLEASQGVSRILAHWLSNEDKD